MATKRYRSYETPAKGRIAWPRSRFWEVLQTIGYGSDKLTGEDSIARRVPMDDPGIDFVRQTMMTETANQTILEDDRPAYRSSFRASLMSLQFKATTLVVALTLSVTAAASSYLLRSSLELARQDHEQGLVRLAAMVARAAADPLARGDSARLAVLVEDVADGRPLLYAVFTDPEGQELAAAVDGTSIDMAQLRSTVLSDAVPGRAVYRRLPFEGPDCLDVRYPIRVDRHSPSTSESSETSLLGYVQVGTLANTWHHWMSSKLDLLIGIGVLAAGIAIPLGFLLVRRIVSPLEGLSATMHRFSLGHLSVRSPVRRHDEIGHLALAFNRMADQHEQTHQRIVKLNTDLERRVAQRTKQLRELAARDPVTGLYNRRHFKEMLERGFSEAIRYRKDLSCIMIDIDDFKAINDNFGHHIGDEVISLAAATITGELRTSDNSARFGGDEFVILLPHTDEGRAFVLAERIAQRFGEELAAMLPQVNTGLSMGIASLESTQVVDAEALVQAADRALYRAKAAGKNCCRVAGTGHKVG